MDTSRLLAVVNDIELEFKGGFVEKLAALNQQYTLARDTPAQDFTAAIQEALLSLETHVANSIFADYPPSKLAILEAINGNDHLGNGFLEQLHKILSITGQTTAGLVTNLTDLHSDLKQFQKANSMTKTGLQSLGVTPYILEAGKFEAGILIPEGLVDSKLGLLAKELELWNKIVRNLQEVAGEEEREVVVTGLAKGSYEVYLPLGIVAAGILAKIIDRIFEWYLKILELRKLRLEIQKLGAPAEEPEKYRKHERDTLEKNITELTTEIMKESHLKIDPNRKHEIEIQVGISIRQIARFVDKGGVIEVYASPLEEANEPPVQPENGEETAEDKMKRERILAEYNKHKIELEEVAKIRDMGNTLRLLPLRTEPILQLADPEPYEESSSLEKSNKKKG